MPDYRKTASAIAVLLLIIFGLFVFQYEKQARANARLEISKHGRVVANALWNFNPEGAAEYLSLACKSQNYQYAVVTDMEGKEFQLAIGPPPGRFEKLFTSAGLIPSVELRSEIAYEGRRIGEITAVWKCDTIYVELTVLSTLVLIFFILLLYVRLLHSKQDLEDRVSRRTNQLSLLNESLKLKIRDEQEARTALLKSEERYRLIAENVADVIWITTMDLTFTYVSPSVFQLRGYTVEEAMAQSVLEGLSPASIRRIMTVYDQKKNLIRAGDPDAWEPVVFEAQVMHRNGTMIWISNNARILKGPDGTPEGILGVSRDITAQKLTEIEKIRAERHAAEQEKHALVGRIAGKMSHDFNNILSVIMGNAELSLLDCSDGRIRETLELILGQTVQGKNLTKNLTAFAKDQEPRQELFDLGEKIDLVINLMKKDLRGIEMILEKSPDLPLLLADPGMIEHTLINLLQNAVHALSLNNAPRIIFRTGAGDGRIWFDIQDNGCGIPEEHIGHIYDPSFTLKGSRDATGSYAKGIKGTGYGMANIKRYIDQHNGIIDIESEPGAGTKITVSLPIIEPDLTSREKAQVLQSIPQSGKRILLVEDEKAISDIQYRILTQKPCGHKVDVAANGEDALHLFRSGTYDAVSLDYILPGSVNGLGVYQEIRKTDKTTPVLFISGNIEFLESIKALKLNDPFVDHLSKPCKNIAYVNSINRLLSMAR